MKRKNFWKEAVVILDEELAINLLRLAENCHEALKWVCVPRVASASQAGEAAILTDCVFLVIVAK